MDRNTGKAPLAGDFGAQYGELILEASDACPVEIIKFELVTDGAEVVEVEAPAEIAAEAVAPAAEAVAVAGAASAELMALMEGDRSLAILFGSQTGNAAGLAEKTAKLAADYGLIPKVYDMDGFDASTLANHKRTLIITSTWGEGEMPDNAESLWQTVTSQGPSLSGVHFSVCAIGDTAYDEFCKAGIDWDDKYQQLGANKVHEIQLCDVDYEPPWALWVAEALPKIACVDSSGTLQIELLEEMIAYGSSGDEDEVSGDFAPGLINKTELTVTLEIFRYCPTAAESGWDTIVCSLPANASVQDMLSAVKSNVDGSLTFRTGDGTGSPTAGLRVNGRLILADTTCISEVIGADGRMKIEPLSGYPVIRDLMVDYSKFEDNRIKAKPWMTSSPREGAYLINGTAVGVMESEDAVRLHVSSDVKSYQLVHSMSDTVNYDSKYEGPGLHLQRWNRVNDPRSSEKYKNSLIASLNNPTGVWGEADLSSIARYGSEGKTASNGLNNIRAYILNQTNYRGPHGRLVKWYGRSVKWTGKLNETTLYRQVLGPVGLISNIFDGVSARMVLGFTRTGGPPIRSLQALILPPAGIGKIPNMFNSKVKNHHQVVGLFNEIDQRF
ncbi:MAG: flavodoxin domain-containing protein [Candidatus Thermoplasmatota archaeon]|nr:flavodoxin domain-containing protein [Candidatus Thermoplasmatota archaeon]